VSVVVVVLIIIAIVFYFWRNANISNNESAIGSINSIFLSILDIKILYPFIILSSIKYRRSYI